jgi:hypothetical protein
MTRDEIYDHLAQVYLGKRKSADDRHKQKFNTWLVLNILITLLILTSAFYGLTAFLVNRDGELRSNVIYALHNGPIRIPYDLNSPYPQVKTFAFSVPEMDVTKYQELRFSVRGLEDGSPGIIKVVLRNRRNEQSSFFVRNVGERWEEVSIPFSEFKGITDWSNVADISFVLEAWNAEKKKGTLLIDNLCFSG